jgi:hypothetical protein
MMESARGQLLGLEEAAKRVGLNAEPFRRLVIAGKGPPATKRPGSNRWFFWANEVDAWFDSGRTTGATAPVPTTRQAHS